MTTPNTQIPEVPEGTLDPAAGLNLALNHIDALLQSTVIEIGIDTPPGSPADGDTYIVGAGTGAWTGEDGNLARYVEEGDFWQFFTAGLQVRIVYNLFDQGIYVFDTVWQPLGGATPSSSSPFVELEITSGGEVEIDLSTARFFQLNLSTDVSSVSITGISSGEVNFFTLHIHQEGGFTFAVPASWTFPAADGTYVVSSSGGAWDLLTLTSYDDAGEWRVKYEKNFS